MKNDFLNNLKMANTWFTTSQVSKIYNIDYKTLLRHRYSKPKRGFPYHIIGRTNKTNGYIRYNKYEIEKYLENPHVDYQELAKSISGDITSPKM